MTHRIDWFLLSLALALPALPAGGPQERLRSPVIGGFQVLLVPQSRSVRTGQPIHLRVKVRNRTNRGRSYGTWRPGVWWTLRRVPGGRMNLIGWGRRRRNPAPALCWNGLGISLGPRQTLEVHLRDLQEEYGRLAPGRYRVRAWIDAKWGPARNAAGVLLSNEVEFVVTP